jgi:hypothetical protein
MRVVTLVLAVSLICSSCNKGLGRLSEDHIRGNVPEQKAFDNLLHRDLTSFLKSQSKSVEHTEVTLLRNGPTQTGISFPKYYAWVRGLSERGVVIEGAVRLAAVGRTHLDVTHFLSRQQILNDPESLMSVFPSALIPEIRRRAAVR